MRQLISARHSRFGQYNDEVNECLYWRRCVEVHISGPVCLFDGQYSTAATRHSTEVNSPPNSTIRLLVLQLLKSLPCHLKKHALIYWRLFSPDLCVWPYQYLLYQSRLFSSTIASIPYWKKRAFIILFARPRTLMKKKNGREQNKTNSCHNKFFLPFARLRTKHLKKFSKMHLSSDRWIIHTSSAKK